jgi:hypothetical protein
VTIHIVDVAAEDSLDVNFVRRVGVGNRHRGVLMRPGSV